MTVNEKVCKNDCIKTSSNNVLDMLESPQWGDSNKYPKNNVLRGNKNKTRSFLPVILTIKDSLQQQIHVTKTYLYNFDPLKPQFYIGKLGFTEVYTFFLFLLKNIDCGYSLEPPRWGGSNEYPKSLFWAEIWKISEFLSENFQFLVVKFSIYLNRCVFVMILMATSLETNDMVEPRVHCTL